jgi:hypothetical protein
MKNYLAIFACDGFSSALSYVVKIGATPEECAAAWSLFVAGDPGATQSHPPSKFFWLMNKNILVATMASIPTLMDPFHATTFTQDEKVAKDFGIDSDFWQGTDTADPNQVKAAKIAKETTGTTGKSNLGGAGDLITNFFNLCDAIIAELKADKSLDRLFRARQISIVSDIELRVREGLLSITDGLQELINDGFLT